MYSSLNLNVPNSLYTDNAFFSLLKTDMHVNKASTQEQVQGVRMRVKQEGKREKKRMSVDIFREKKRFI